MKLPDGQNHYFCLSDTDSVFLHLIRHFQKNDLNILGLLSSQNNEIFLRYFKENLKRLILNQYAQKGAFEKSRLPEDFLVNHISSSFTHAIEWWISKGMKDSPETITEYFLCTVEALL